MGDAAMYMTTRQRNEKKLEEQIAFVRWRRMQNERKIRQALETTKSLQMKDALMNVSMDVGSERSMWMSSVIRDELSRPLVITDEELHRLQESEAKTKRKLRQFTQVKLGTINKIQNTLKEQAKYISTEVAHKISKEKKSSMKDIQKRTKATLKEVEARKDLVVVTNIPPKIFD
jgi:hypothetical protein